MPDPVDLDRERVKVLADNLRFYSDARFKQLSLFLAWITLLGGALFQFGDKEIAKQIGFQSALPAFAMLVTSAFWVMEIRSSLSWRANRDAAPDMWPRSPVDGWAWFNATNAVFLLYTAIFIVWLLLGIALASNPAFYVIPGLLGLTVFAFGVTSYVRYSQQGSTRRTGA